MTPAGEKFAELVQIMAKLRAPGGCPWDREQTFDTIKPYTLEETYEVFDAIDKRDWRELAEELGDLMLQVVFYAQMADEAGHFTINDALDAINAKLIRRHPHVFAAGTADTADAVKKRWDEIKAEEKQSRREKPKGLLEGVPRGMPALAEASQIHDKAAAVGFDWANVDQVFAKLDEEVAELHEARREHSDIEHIEHELGDVLGTIVNIARYLKVNPEQAMRKANGRFRQRFGYVESALAERGKTPQQSDIHEMDALWNEAKRQA